MRVLVALGGNAILQRGQQGLASGQRANVQKTVEQIVRIEDSGYVCIYHADGE